MKKKLALFLCVLLCLTAFTGCSRAELAYLNMGRELIENMDSCRVEGSMQAEIDYDALQVIEADVAKATGVEYEADETAMNGKKAFTVDYVMDMSLSSMEYVVSLDVQCEGRQYDLGKIYYSMTKGVFVTGDTLWGLYQMAGDWNPGYKDSYLRSEAFAKDFREILSEERYFELVSAEELTGVDMDSAMYGQSYGTLYEAALTFYENVLDGFETGLVKEIKGGYRIEADGHEAVQLLVNLLYFVAANPEQVIDATETYMMTVMDTVEGGTPEETAQAKAEMAYMFADMRASQADFINAAAGMAMLLESLMEDERVDMLLDTFHYTATVKKTGLGFEATAAYTVKHEGKTAFSLITKSVTKEADVQIYFPLQGMSAEELDDKLVKLENKYNPVTGVAVTWGMYGENSYADIQTMRSVAEGVYFGSNYNWSELIVEDGRAYLPLRVIAEALGEEVGWENSTKTPYVVKDGERIDMKGRLQDDRAFVGVRDFEKLGYTVTYTAHKDASNDLFSYKEVVIEK